MRGRVDDFLGRPEETNDSYHPASESKGSTAGRRAFLAAGPFAGCITSASKTGQANQAAASRWPLPCTDYTVRTEDV